MNPLPVLVLFNWFLPALVLTAPASPQNQGLKKAVEQTKMVLDKVLETTATIPGLTLTPPSQSTDLDRMRKELDIPNPPTIEPLSPNFTLDMCMSHMLAGIQLHQSLVSVLSGKLSGLSNLNSDLRDLKLRIDKMKEAAHLSDTSGLDQNSSSDLVSHLDTDYNVQVAVHLTLTQLQTLCQDMIRSLRNINSYYRLGAALH
ncbi:uncharacterized protein LOC114859856 isoform X2 [Betta splendens]|uniref:Uncharacterized protein LOC114859856 isoform X2 n=1 Tax=Betta splendens TaxID=158456 RepID=A0A6P7N339_BETSP|nr:uncharacterized protein LOC114859856 isoform X2 [Betta splendens]